MKKSLLPFVLMLPAALAMAKPPADIQAKMDAFIKGSAGRRGRRLG